MSNGRDNGAEAPLKRMKLEPPRQPPVLAPMPQAPPPPPSPMQPMQQMQPIQPLLLPPPVTKPSLSPMPQSPSQQPSGPSVVPSFGQLPKAPVTLQAPSPSLQLPPVQTPVQGQVVQAPKPFDFTSLDKRKTVNEAGLWQMSDTRRQELDDKVGTYTTMKSPTSEDIRITAVQEKGMNWGNSADENAPTRFLRDQHGKMQSKVEAETLFNQRSHQAMLTWATESPAFTQYGHQGNDDQPISGHTPGIKSLNVGGNTGSLTKEHGTRDNQREANVTKTFEDPKRSEFDTAVMAKLSTVQLMMSPKEELSGRKQDIVGSKQHFYSQFSDIGDISESTGKQFDMLVERAQVVRETEKMHAARNLLALGHDTLVPKAHRELLEKSGGDVDKAMQLLHQESTAQKPSMTFNAKSHSDTDRLDKESLREMADPKRQGTRPRALSDPRRVNAPNFKF